MTVFFLLPGWTRHHSGGYAVVRCYADWIAGEREPVEVHYARAVQPDRLAHLQAIRSVVVRALATRGFISWPARPMNPVQSNFLERNHAFRRGRLKAAANDVIIATSWHTVEWALDEASRAGAHGVYFVQGDERWSGSSRAVIETWKAPLRPIVVSQHLERTLAAQGVESTVVNNPIRDAFFHHSPPLSQRGPVVSALFSNQANKQPELLRCAIESTLSIDAEVEFVIFGEKPPWRIRDSRVRTVGPLAAQQLAQLLRRSRLFLSTSRSEGWCLPATEAVLSGAGVVATDSGGVSEASGGCAVIVDRDIEPQSLAEIIVATIADSTLMQTRVMVGRQRLMERMRIDVSAARFYRNLRPDTVGLI